MIISFQQHPKTNFPYQKNSDPQTHWHESFEKETFLTLTFFPNRLWKLRNKRTFPVQKLSHSWRGIRKPSSLTVLRVSCNYSSIAILINQARTRRGVEWFKPNRGREQKRELAYLKISPGFGNANKLNLKVCVLPVFTFDINL